MIHENNLVAVSHSDGNAYRSSEAAELTLNAAILRAEIARTYEEFLGAPMFGKTFPKHK